MKKCKTCVLFFIFIASGFSVFAQTESQLIYTLEDDERLATNEYHLITGTGSAGWAVVVLKRGQGAQVIMENKRLGAHDFTYVTQESIISPDGNVWFMILKADNGYSYYCISDRGTEYGPFDSIEPESFLFDKEGDWSFVFHKGKNTYIQTNKNVLGPFYRTTEHIKRSWYGGSGSSIRYYNREDGKYLIHDGADYGPYKNFYNYTVTDSYWAFRGVKDDGDCAVVNGKEYGPYHKVLNMLALNDSLWAFFIKNKGDEKSEGALINGVDYGGFDTIHSIIYAKDNWVLSVKKKEDNGKEYSYLVSATSEYGPFDSIQNLQLTDKKGLWYAAVVKSGNQYIISPDQEEYTVEKCGYLLIDKATDQWTASLLEKGVWNIRSKTGATLAVYDSRAYEPYRKPTTSFDWTKWENQQEKQFFYSAGEEPIHWTWKWYGERSYRPESFTLSFPDGEEFPNAFNLFPEKHDGYVTFYFYTIDRKDIFFHKKRVNSE